MAQAYYDDSNLQRLFAELEPKRRVQALKGGFRRAANKVRKRAVENLRASIHTDADLAKGVRAVVFKKKAGFRVTVGTKNAGRNGKGERGFHTNRRGFRKPVLIWAEDGTSPRSYRKLRATRIKSRVLHYTGRMPRYGFMTKTQSEMKGPITAYLHDEIRENIKRTAKKYGCK